MLVQSTISGISTTLGEGGIGIIRISGSRALEVANMIVKLKAARSVLDVASHTVNYGHVYDPQTKENVDEILLLFMKSPHSYTVEDVVEIHCHGGLVSIRRIFELTLRYGACPAEPGEFTKRAFLNGRIDLTQAGGAGDFIRSKIDAASRVALYQLDGKLSKQIKKLGDDLLEIIAYVEAAIDFPEEDLEHITVLQINERTRAMINQIQCLLDTAHSGKIIREGLRTVIVGKPNVGKSSLLNALLKENRAIVTNVPGTTRDIIEEQVNIKGIPLIIVDTAGMRDTENVVERIGVERAKELLEIADLVLVVLDASLPLTEDDLVLLRELINKTCILVINKTDLPIVLEEEKIKAILPRKLILHISILENKGIDLLETKIVDLVYNGNVVGNEGGIITNARHQYALQRAQESLQDVLKTIEGRMPVDCIVVDVRAAWEALGEITGETLSEDIVEQIFSTFCIGK